MYLMRKNIKLLISGIIFLFFQSLCLITSVMAEGKQWDICPYGDLSYWSDKTGVLGRSINEIHKIKVPQTGDNEWNVGVWWKEERDINGIEVEYNPKVTELMARETQIQYWFLVWPQKQPKGHSVEDQMDDPWQGKWVTANTSFKMNGNKVVYTFNPLTTDENIRATNLSNPVDYRRTLKVRLLYKNAPPEIKSFKVYSPTDSQNMSVRIEFLPDKLTGKKLTGKLEIYNGQIKKVSGWKMGSEDQTTHFNSWTLHMKNQSKGICAELVTASPELPGSNDQTVVTVRTSEGSFSFLTHDLDHGSIYIPAFSSRITLASDTSKFVASKAIIGQTIREKLKVEPEQTFSRASREIPQLSVNMRENGTPLCLPLAADASWQKFGFEWSGGFYMSRTDTKAKGNEAKRCLWTGDKFIWNIGTGKDPVYQRDDKNAHMSVLNDYLPVPQVLWHHEGLIFHEEAFATLMEGPLSPDDAGRSEQTPAILMMKLDVSNPSSQAKTAHVWLKGSGIDHIQFRDLAIFDRRDGNDYLRATIKAPDGVTLSSAKLSGGEVELCLEIGPNQSAPLYISFPFVGDLTEKDKERIVSLDYLSERQRVISYWRDLVDKCVQFNVPEPKFNEMAKSVITHIRMSTTKDPKSGLYMVPAASFYYMVFANESAFQTIYLDMIGDHKTAANYLETFLKLQGKAPMLGSYSGDQSAVFHGAKVDDVYNYTHQNYNLDHGTVLWALALHYLLTGDTEWLNHAAPNMLKAAEWIIEQRNQTKITGNDGTPVLHYGLLPGGHLEDNSDWGYWFATNAYACIGLQSTAEAFRKAGLPQANQLEKEANDYLSDLRNSVKRTSELSPVVRLRNNTWVPFVPTRAHQRFRYFGPMLSDYYSRYGVDTTKTTRLYRLSATREVLYGPMVLVTTGIIQPNDPLAEAILDDWEDNITMTSSLGLQIHGEVEDEYWFSRGGMVFQPNLQNPIKAYLLRNEIPAAIRNLYNGMVSCFFPDVNAFTEEYHKWGLGSGPMYKVADEARCLTRINDLLVMENNDELWLAPGTPRYWLEPGKEIRLYHTATVFGNVSYVLKSGSAPHTVEAEINLPANFSAKKIKLFVRSPLEKPIKAVTVNGKIWNDWDSAKEVIDLPMTERNMNILVTY